MKYLLGLVLMLGTNTLALAQSTIVGTWAADGQSLVIDIVDNPSEYPFVAGKLWKAMLGDRKTKSIQTPNFELKCDAALDSRDRRYGTCFILVSRASVTDNFRNWAFAIWRDEASAALEQLVPIPFNDSVRNDDDSFILSWDRKHKSIGFVISKSRVQD